MMSNNVHDNLQDCLDRIAAGESPEQALSRYPEQRAELAPLLATAADLRNAPGLSPTAKTRVREQLHGALRAHALQRSWGINWPLWLFRAGLTVVIVLLLWGGGWLAVSNAAPGERLFAVKVAVNETRVRYVSDPRTALDLRLQILEDRMAEGEYIQQGLLGGFGQQGLTELLEQTSSTVTFMELQVSILTPADLQRINRVIERERNMIRLQIARRPERRRPLESMLQFIALWEPTLQRLQQQVR